MHKRQHASRAAELLSDEEEANLKYAALELRMAIEEIVYEKLKLYAPRLPAEVVDKWQPPQAVRALLEFEPRATSDKIVRFSREATADSPAGEWKTLGSHRSFKLPWLRRAYHLLGSLLHAPAPKSAAKFKSPARHPSIRQELRDILAEVEAVAASQMDSSLARVVTFECAACDAPVICNEDGARRSGRAVCLDPSCGAHHAAEFRLDGSVVFHLIATEFDCMKCDGKIPVENRKLSLNFRFRCQRCGSWHSVVEAQWGYALEADLKAAKDETGAPPVAG